MTLVSVTEQIRNDYDNATRDWVEINDPRRRRAMWHQRVIRDREITLQALRVAGLVLASYEIGVGNPVKLPLRRTAEALGIDKRAFMNARDLLVERRWLIRVNDGSSQTALYHIGPGPMGESNKTPMGESQKTPQSNKSLTRLSESKRSQSRGPIADREDKSRAVSEIDWPIDDSGDDCPF